MSLRPLGYVALPGEGRAGSLDHAAVHQASSRLYVAHTSNDAVDVLDCASDEYLHSIPGLPGVAGVLVAEGWDLVFTSNRAENTVSLIPLAREGSMVKVGVGIRPNGLAFDSRRGVLLAANVGDPQIPRSHTVSLVDVKGRTHMCDLSVPGRTRWAVYDREADAFFVNIADPPEVVAIDAGDPSGGLRSFKIPARGPHGLDLDPKDHVLFCACDDGTLVTLDPDTGKAAISHKLSGAPDVLFLNGGLHHLYVALKDPGAVDVFETTSMEHLETIATEAGAGTMGFDARRNKLYAFLPRTSRTAVFEDPGARGA